MKESDLIDKIRKTIESHVDKTHKEFPIKDDEWQKTKDTRKAKKADLVAEIDGQTIAFEIKTTSGRIGKAIKQAQEYQKHFDSVCIVTQRKPRQAIQKQIINQGIGLWLWKKGKLFF